MNAPKSCHAYYYGGLPVKGPRRKGRLWMEGDAFSFVVPGKKGDEGIDLRIPVKKMEKISLTRDNYYGSDTVLFNLTFRDESGKFFTIRFAPITLIPRRRIALQEEWFNYLTQMIQDPPACTLEEKGQA